MGPRQSPTGTKSDGGGGTCKKKIRLKPKLPTSCKIRPFFAILSMKYSFLLKVLLSLKVVKFDTKNVFKFFIFLGTNLGWGGQTLVQKRGQVSDRGGIGKIFAGWGEPPSPPFRKKPCSTIVVPRARSKNKDLQC